MRRLGRRSMGRGVLGWLWANPLVLAVIILLIVLTEGWYIRNEWIESQEAEKLRKR